MPQVPIIMPQLGESIAEATVVRLTVKVGDQIESDQEVIEVETNKAVMSVTTPCKGFLESITAEVNETYPVGSILGYIEASVEDAERLNASEPPPMEAEWSAGRRKDAPADQSLTSDDSNQDPSHRLEIPAGQNGAAFQSPRLRARLQELGIHPADAGMVPGSGIAGRVTIHDFEAYLEELNQLPSKKASPMRLAVADSMRRGWARPLGSLGVF